jgi:hypothetical protein
MRTRLRANLRRLSSTECSTAGSQVTADSASISPGRTDPGSRPNADQLSRCREAFGFDRWRAGVGDGCVAGAFDPVGVVPGAFDDAGAGPHPAWRVEPFQHLGEDCGGGRGELVRGERPPAALPGEHRIGHAAGAWRVPPGRQPGREDPPGKAGVGGQLMRGRPVDRVRPLVSWLRLSGH